MAANNILQTVDLITRYTLARFIAESPFIQTSSRQVEKEWFSNMEYQYGDSVRVRKRNLAITRDTQIAQFDAIQEQYENIIVNHNFNNSFTFSTKDLTLFAQGGRNPKQASADFYERYIKPQIDSSISNMNAQIALEGSYDLNYFIGTPGTPINSIGTMTATKAHMMKMGINLAGNSKAYMALGSDDIANLQNQYVTIFNNTLNEEIGLSGILPKLGAFNLWDVVTLSYHEAGNFGAGPITVSAGTASGNTISMTGLTPSDLVFTKGDRFSVAGVKAVNPLVQTRSIAGQFDMQFVVASDVVSDIGGNAVVPVKPAFISDDADPNKNISNPIPFGAEVTAYGSHNVGIAYITDALSLVVPRQADLLTVYSSTQSDDRYGVSIRLVADGDVKNNVNGWRLDVLWGAKWHQQYAVVVMS